MSRRWLAAAIAVVSLLLVGCEPMQSAIDGAQQAVSNWLTQQVVTGTQWLVDVLLVMPVEYLTTSEFGRIYGLISMCAAAALLPIIGYIGLSGVVGRSETSMATVMARGLISMAAITVTPRVVAALAQTTNRLSQSLIGATVDRAAIGGALVPKGAEWVMVILLAVYLAFVLRLLLWYAYRNYALLAMTVLGPIAWIMYLVPGQEQRTRQWVSDIVSLMTTQMVHSLFIVLLVLIAGCVAPDASPAGRWSVLMLQLGALQFMTSPPSWLRGLVMRAPAGLNIRLFTRRLSFGGGDNQP